MKCHVSGATDKVMVRPDFFFLAHDLPPFPGSMKTASYAMTFGGDDGYKDGTESIILSVCAESMILSARAQSIILSAGLLLPPLPNPRAAAAEEG